MKWRHDMTSERPHAPWRPPPKAVLNLEPCRTRRSWASFTLSAATCLQCDSADLAEDFPNHWHLLKTCVTTLGQEGGESGRQKLILQLSFAYLTQDVRITQHVTSWQWEIWGRNRRGCKFQFVASLDTAMWIVAEIQWFCTVVYELMKMSCQQSICGMWWILVWSWHRHELAKSNVPK